MKVMVCLKQVPHQDARLDVNADGTWIQEDNIKFEINSYDTYAVEEALKLKDAGSADEVDGRLDRPGPRHAGAAHGPRHGCRSRDPRQRRGGAPVHGRARYGQDPRRDREGRVRGPRLRRSDGRRRQRLGDPADGRRAARLPERDRRAGDRLLRRRGQGRARARRRRARGRRAAQAVPDRDPVGCEPGPLRVAQGHHAGQEEAGGREDARRPRPRGLAPAPPRTRPRSRRSTCRRRATPPRSCRARRTRSWASS